MKQPRLLQRDHKMNDEGGNGWVGILIFVLIFGVGNVILYITTGIVIIPIRR